MKFFVKIGLILCFLVGLQSCRKDGATTWKSNWVAPLASGRLTLADFISDSLLQADDSGLVHLHMQRNFDQFALDSVVVLPDTSLQKTFVADFPGSITLPPNFPVIVTEDMYDIDLGDMQLQEANMRSGRFVYVIKNYVAGNLEVNFSFPDFSLNGQVLETTEKLPPKLDGVPGSVTGFFDVTGYDVNLRGADGNSFNIMRTSASAKTDPDVEGSTLVNAQDSITIEITLDAPALSFAYGYLGQKAFSAHELLDLSVAEDVYADALFLAAGRMDLVLYSYLGIDAVLNLNQLTAHGESQSMDLIAPELMDTLQMARAQRMGDQVIPQRRSFRLDNGNSNLNEWLSVLPKSVDVDLSALLNPAGDAYGSTDFVYTEQVLGMEVVLDIPLRLSARSLRLEKALEISTDMKGVEKALLTLKAENSFLFGGDMKLQLVDPSGKVLFDLPLSGTLLPGAIDAFGNSQGAVVSNLELALSAEMLHGFVPGNFLLVTVDFDTAQYPDLVSVRASDFLNISVIGDLIYEMEVRP